jgi:hypothetical protein
MYRQIRVVYQIAMLAALPTVLTVLSWFFLVSAGVVEPLLLSLNMAVTRANTLQTRTFISSSPPSFDPLFLSFLLLLLLLLNDILSDAKFI